MLQYDVGLLEAHRYYLATEEAKKRGDCIESVPGNPKDLYPCKRYKLIATPAICRRCQADPFFKQALFARYLDGQAERLKSPCKYAGPVIGKRTIMCCGNTKDTDINIFVCALRGDKVAEPDCWICESYE